MSIAKQEQRRPSKRFNTVLLAITLCVQIVGLVVALNQAKWTVAGALVALAALTIAILRGLVRGRIS